MKRPNGTGNVYKPKGRSTWTARVVDHYVPSDNMAGIKPVWKTKGGFRTKRDALNYLPTLKDSPSALKKMPTLFDYWNMYESGELQALSHNRQDLYRKAWERLKPIHHYKIADLTVAILRDTVTAAASTFYTARACKNLLSHLFKLAGADGLVSKDLPSYIILPKLEETERETFTPEEQASLWALWESGCLNASMPLIMIYTGMMPGELMQLKTEYIDLEHRMITGVGLKTKVRRESPIYLPDDIIPILETMIEKKGAELWYCSDKSSFRRWYYATLEKAGCRHLEPYCCRHTMATRLAVTEQIAPQTVQRIMRWSSTKMLDRYAHPDVADITDALKKIRRGL